MTRVGLVSSPYTDYPLHPTGPGTAPCRVAPYRAVPSSAAVQSRAEPGHAEPVCSVYCSSGVL